MIDLDAASLALIKKIIQKILPGVEVKAFGSRVTGTAKKFSDLDLVVIGDKPINESKLDELKFAFSNSNLEIMVDVIDWHRISNEFRTAIQADCVTLVPSK